MYFGSDKWCGDFLVSPCRSNLDSFARTLGTL